MLLLQTTGVQTYVAGKIADALAGTAIDADISFSKIHLKPFSTLIIRDLSVTDRTPGDTLGQEVVDTLFKAGYISARFTLKGLTGRSISIANAHVQDAVLNLVIEDGKYSTNLTRMFRIPEGRDRPDHDREIFSIKEVNVDSMRFTMKNYTSRRKEILPGGIDWYDMDIRDIRIRGRHLKLKGKVMSGEVDMMSFREKSGYTVTSLSGKTRTGRGMALIEGLKLTDSQSSLDIPYFAMLYEDAADFADFVNKVRLEGIIRPSRASLETIGYFAPSLKGNNAAFDISGEVYGTVASLDLDNLSFEDADKSIRGKLSGHVEGLPDTGKMTVKARVGNLSFTMASLERFLGKWTDAGLPELRNYARGVRFYTDCSVYGRPDDMQISLRTRSRIGKISANLDIKGLTGKSRERYIKGTIDTDNIDLSRIIDRMPVHQCTLKAGLRADFGNGEEGASLNIDSLRVSRMNLNGYDYSGIAATGTLSGRRFNGKVICTDPNLNFMFQGIFSFSGKTNNALYRFYANIGYADLDALHIDKRGTSRISLQTNANFTRTSRGDMLGNIDIAGISLENAQGRYDIGDVRISSFTGSGRYRIRLTSDFAEASYSGSAPLTSFARDLSGVTLKRELPALFKDPSTVWRGENYEINFTVLDCMDLLSFLAPGLYIANETSIKASIDTSGLFNARMVSQRIAFNEQYIKDMDFEISNAGGSVSGELKSDNIYLATVMMKNNSIKLLADDNHIGAEFSYDNQDILENKGEFVIVGNIGRSEDNENATFDIEFLPSSIYLNTREWNIYPSSIFIEGKDINVKRIEFRSGRQSILASGGLSEEKPDTLDINLDRFDLSIINPLIGEHFSLQGEASGLARITSPGRDRGILLDIICDSSSIAGRRIGELAVKSSWNGESKRFDLTVENDLDGNRSLSLKGNYTPSKKWINMDAALSSLDLSYASPFLRSIFSGMDGAVSGQFSLNGPMDNLAISSSGARLDKARLTIAYTNVEYTVDGAFSADPEGIYFDNITVQDRYGNAGRIEGNIGYDHFRDMRFDIGINVNRIEAVNLSEEQGETFYGNLFASGMVRIKGPMNSLSLSADASTAGRGEIHIPISSSLTSGSTNLLKFKEPEKEEEIDPYEQMITRIRKQKEKSDFAVKLRVSTTPEVEAFIEIDKASGNVLRGRGAGTIELDIRPGDDLFNILGDYTINSGNYHFVALGIASRDFSINDGSTIRFNGEIMESTLNISAVYRTKASLSTLIADENSVDNRRTVECGIQITDKISNPRLSFSINVPDLNPTVKARVESALSTEDKVQKQFLALLISNSFLPDEQSGITNNSSMLFSNVTEIMTNQLNNIFQKLSIPLDLGFSYQQNTQGNDVFDVAVSTQLFNNRVIVNGNIGNRQYSTSSNQNSDVVGDIDIEIKIDRPGAFRLNLFSHSADLYTNYLDNSQRNGIGLSYQKEFNRFGDFIRRLFQGKKKREASELQDAMDAINEEKNYIKIEAE